MIEALWTAEFVSNENVWGTGVVIMETQRVLGGDGQFFYVGRYETRNGEIKATIDVNHYAWVPGSIFGDLREFSLKLEGTVEKNQFELDGHMVDQPDKLVKIRLTRRAELP